MLHDDIAHRMDAALRQIELRVRVPRPQLRPARPPRAQGRPEVAQALQRKQVRAERNDDEIAGDQRRAVDRPEIRSHVDQDPVRAHLLRSLAHGAVKGGHDAERGLVAVVAPRPRIGQLVLEGGEREIADDEVQARTDALHIGRLHVAQPAEDRPQGAENRSRMIPVRPELLQLGLVEEHAGEIGLRIQIGRQYRRAALGQHPRQVIHQRRLPDTALVVEEGERSHVRLWITARK
ncbi:MAG: hypothetical protein RML12_00335 [Xanthomonadales bacterium]|nr:hypothetical protein [Xanthomonadales bacterium]